MRIIIFWPCGIFNTFCFLAEANEGPGRKRKGAKQAEGESRWTCEQQPSRLR